MFLKYFISLTIFRKTFGSVLRYASQWLCLYILSSKGANQLLVLFINTFGNLPLKLKFSNVSPKILLLKRCRSFRTKSEELVLENYVLAYHTADKDHAKFL